MWKKNLVHGKKKKKVTLDSSFRPPGFSPYMGEERKESSRTGLSRRRPNGKKSMEARITCSHVRHMFNHEIACPSIKQYQFTGRDVPVQKSSGVAILVSLQECGVFQNITLHRATSSGKPQAKIRLAFFERKNTIK